MSPIVFLSIFQIIILASVLLMAPIIARIGTIDKVEFNSPLADEMNAEDVNSIVTPKVFQPKPTAADDVENFSKLVAKNMIKPPKGIQWLPNIESHIIKLTNTERKKRGLSKLERDQYLQDGARFHSADMIRRVFFSHVTPDDRTPFDRIAIIHRKLIGTSGENIWMSEGQSPQNVQQFAKNVVESWMKSTGHRENILRDNFSHIGVGVAIKGNVVKITQKFASVQAWFANEIPQKIKKGKNLIFVLSLLHKNINL
ncbi:CAP domain-containing protein [Candidatus Venteria ishoeyi]|uniref:Cysteine-rich secretory protein family protein n=1 Tax=Candidatus Venteria ishoeyi TaxID=1899563 RepID=A0A1H6F6F0_9GAMM|nr:CAP domain-containing protein [Candidatus Venteria ishoeyi]SEH05747.1 Cysteine-rich secretory protein family protein [Candidatus Venteria ishoeyi]